MELLTYILLGAVQGLTEFLPVSSSGHLVIFQNIIPGFNQTGILLEAFLHGGTLLSVVYFFRKSIIRKSMNYWILIAVATIPVVLVGLTFGNQVESFFENIRLTGVALLVTGTMNYITNSVKKKGDKLSVPKKIIDLKIKKPLLIGLFQAFAIIPGISRSGSTIFVGRKLGLDKKSATEFSFLMSIPAVLGANIFEFLSSSGKVNGFNYLYIVGFVAAFISGVFAIKVVLKFLEKSDYKYFSYYAFVLGFMVTLLSF